MTTDTPQSRNELSGTTNGNVVQIGAVHGGVHYGASQSQGIEDIGALSHSRAAELLSAVTPDAIVSQLARVDVAFAAKVIERMEDDLAISIVTRMNATRLPLVLAQMTAETADLLRAAATAAHEIDTTARQWRSKLGKPAGDLRSIGPSTRGTTGFCRDYAQGSVYWNARTGSGIIHADMADYFNSHRGIGGWLGFPIGPETPAATSAFGTTGTFQRFESTWDYSPEPEGTPETRYGATVYRSQHGTFTTRGGIGEYFEGKGDIRGPLGFPMSNERRVRKSPEAYVQIFEGGHVAWSEATGVATVGPAITSADENWLAHLGLPRGEAMPAETSPFGTEGVIQNFEFGVSTCAEASSATEVTYGACDQFLSHGATGGAFGFPTSDKHLIALTLSAQGFEGGLIFSKGLRRAFGVTGPIFVAFDADPDLLTRLGWPIGPEQPIGAGPDSIRFFERGLITVVSGEAKCWFQNEQE